MGAQGRSRLSGVGRGPPVSLTKGTRRKREVMGNRESRGERCHHDGNGSSNEANPRALPTRGLTLSLANQNLVFVSFPHFSSTE